MKIEGFVIFSVFLTVLFGLSFITAAQIMTDNNNCVTDSDCLNIINSFCENLSLEDNSSCVERHGDKCVEGTCKKNNSENESDCKELYYFDNENKNCDKEKFCGMYTYYGLQVFGSKAQCEHELNNSKPEFYVDEDCPTLCPECIDAPENYECGECIQLKCANGRCVNGNVKDCPNGTEQENGHCMFRLSNGRKGEVKIMPSTASERAIERLGELNFTIELKEVEKGNESKVVYELKGEKKGKFLGIFKIMGRVSAQIDAETGEAKVIKPWWSFLANGI